MSKLNLSVFSFTAAQLASVESACASSYRVRNSVKALADIASACGDPALVAQLAQQVLASLPKRRQPKAQPAPQAQPAPVAQPAPQAQPAPALALQGVDTQALLALLTVLQQSQQTPQAQPAPVAPVTPPPAPSKATEWTPAKRVKCESAPEGENGFALPWVLSVSSDGWLKFGCNAKQHMIASLPVLPLLEVLEQDDTRSLLIGTIRNAYAKAQLLA